VSAGGVVLRRAAEALEVVLVRPAGKADTWCLPKGLVDAAAGETPAAAAVREVREESGFAAEVVLELEPVSYVYVDRWRDVGAKVFKTVHFFLMRATGGDPAGHDHEVAEVRSVPLPQAVKMASYKGEKALLASLAKGTAGEAAARALVTI
jgi:8-oxo-dGTP diphosphatase